MKTVHKIIQNEQGINSSEVIDKNAKPEMSIVSSYIVNNRTLRLKGLSVLKHKVIYMRKIWFL